MAAILEPDVLVTSYDVITSCCRPQRRQFVRIICPPSFFVIALIFSELRGGGRISSPTPPSPVPEDQKNRSPPGQGKINVWALSDVSEKKGKHADLLDLLIECKKNLHAFIDLFDRAYN